jgi:hypothetical protein
MKRAFRRFSLLIVAVTMAGAALAQYPAKPVRIVVPYPPGGTSAIARESRACSIATSFTRSRRSRTNKNRVGDFRAITRARVALLRSQPRACKASDALTRGLDGNV